MKHWHPVTVMKKLPTPNDRSMIHKQAVVVSCALYLDLELLSSVESVLSIA